MILNINLSNDSQFFKSRSVSSFLVKPLRIFDLWLVWLILVSLEAPRVQSEWTVVIMELTPWPPRATLSQPLTFCVNHPPPLPCISVLFPFPYFSPNPCSLARIFGNLQFLRWMKMICGGHWRVLWPRWPIPWGREGETTILLSCLIYCPVL